MFIEGFFGRQLENNDNRSSIKYHIEFPIDLINFEFCISSEDGQGKSLNQLRIFIVKHLSVQIIDPPSKDLNHAPKILATSYPNQSNHPLNHKSKTNVYLTLKTLLINQQENQRHLITIIKRYRKPIVEDAFEQHPWKEADSRFK